MMDQKVLEELLAEGGGTLPKRYWGRGPWQREPDFCDWRHAGFHCGAWRSDVTGAWAAYVGVPGDHPFFGKHCRECVVGCEPEPQPAIDPDDPISALAQRSDVPTYSCGHTPTDLVAAHREINFAGPRPWDPGLWWFGFDCAHVFDYSPGLEALTAAIMPPEHTARRRAYRRMAREHGLESFGFGERYRSLIYVRRVTNVVAVQLRVRPHHHGRWPKVTLVGMLMAGAR